VSEHDHAARENDDVDLDRLLASAARHGDRDAFARLVRRTSRLVWSSIALRLGGRDRSTIDELTQETYLSAWRSIRTIDDPSRLRPWLLRIAERLTIDHARRRRPAQIGETDVAAADEGPPETSERSERRRRVLAALAELPEQYQQALSLRFLAGADYREIEKQLALSNGSLRGLLHRGLKMLKEKLGDENP
jgi:RNA polymerase sigma-70 factor (ECF subfamily)